MASAKTFTATDAGGSTTTYQVPREGSMWEWVVAGHLADGVLKPEGAPEFPATMVEESRATALEWLRTKAGAAKRGPKPKTDADSSDTEG